MRSVSGGPRSSCIRPTELTGLMLVLPRNPWTLRYEVQSANLLFTYASAFRHLPGTNDDMGLPGKEVAWNPDASWLASKGMGWYAKNDSEWSAPPPIVGGDDEVVEGSVDALSSLELGRDFFSTGGCWSTGKNWHSLRCRIQFSHRPWGSSAATRHRIFRRRQCTIAPEHEHLIDR